MSVATKTLVVEGVDFRLTLRPDSHILEFAPRLLVKVFSIHCRPNVLLEEKVKENFYSESLPPYDISYITSFHFKKRMRRRLPAKAVLVNFGMRVNSKEVTKYFELMNLLHGLPSELVDLSLTNPPADVLVEDIGNSDFFSRVPPIDREECEPCLPAVALGDKCEEEGMVVCLYENPGGCLYDGNPRNRLLGLLSVRFPEHHYWSDMWWFLGFPK